MYYAYELLFLRHVKQPPSERRANPPVMRVENTLKINFFKKVKCQVNWM